MPRKLTYEISVLEDLKRTPRADQRFILESLDKFAQGYSDAFAEELRRTGKLLHLQTGWKGCWQLRLRSYRIFFREYDETLLILLVVDGNRNEASR